MILILYFVLSRVIPHWPCKKNLLASALETRMYFHCDTIVFNILCVVRFVAFLFFIHSKITTIALD
jgi:hypothetical protein